MPKGRSAKSCWQWRSVDGLDQLLVSSASESTGHYAMPLLGISISVMDMGWECLSVHSCQS